MVLTNTLQQYVTVSLYHISTTCNICPISIVLVDPLLIMQRAWLWFCWGFCIVSLEWHRNRSINFTQRLSNISNDTPQYWENRCNEKKKKKVSFEVGCILLQPWPPTQKLFLFLWLSGMCFEVNLITQPAAETYSSSRVTLNRWQQTRLHKVGRCNVLQSIQLLHTICVCVSGVTDKWRDRKKLKKPRSVSF